jgi:hypothetical protein
MAGLDLGKEIKAMGMSDYVELPPELSAKCGGEQKWQTKGLGCDMDAYRIGLEDGQWKLIDSDGVARKYHGDLYLITSSGETEALARFTSGRLESIRLCEADGMKTVWHHENDTERNASELLMKLLEFSVKEELSDYMSRFLGWSDEEIDSWMKDAQRITGLEVWNGHFMRASKNPGDEAHGQD